MRSLASVPTHTKSVSDSQVLMVRFCMLFDPKGRMVTFLNGQTYPLPTLRALGMGSLLDAVFEFSEKLATLGLKADEMALFMAVVLVSAGESSSFHLACEQSEFTPFLMIHTQHTRSHSTALPTCEPK